SPPDHRAVPDRGGLPVAARRTRRPRDRRPRHLGVEGGVSRARLRRARVGLRRRGGGRRRQRSGVRHHARAPRGRARPRQRAVGTLTTMRSADFVRLIAQSVVAHPMRSTLTALGIGIGVTAVVLLTSIGEGVNRYIVEQFTQFGTTTLAVQPGKSSTLGISPGALNSVRPLSLADAEALTRAPYVLHAVPVVTGSGSIE